MKNGSLLLAALIVLSGCSQPQPQQPQTKPQSPSQPSPPPSGQQAAFPVQFDHVVVVIEENHSHSEIHGSAHAPYLNSLISQSADFSNFHAIEHPSQPNYLDLFSGANQGVTNDSPPANKFSTQNLGSELLDHHLTFTGYSEDLPSVGFNGPQAGHGTQGRATYARKHNPWANFTNLPADVNRPFADFPKDFSQLPTVSFVIPNMEHDMHDGTIQQADSWMHENLDPYVQWARTHNSLLVVTWDEDDQSQQNKIPTFIVGPKVRNGTYNENVNHFGLLRTIEDLYGLPHAGASATATPITDIWQP